ncbi:MAG: hypothetical protein IPM18_00135 [Phycisphaerales bacterium]|nr:hypothetical protein [Phycisphaerales bacterium]
MYNPLITWSPDQSARLLERFEADAAEIDNGGPDALPLAICYWLGFPEFREYLGPWRDDTAALYALLHVHERAVTALIIAAEEIDLDGGAFHVAGRVAVRVFGGEDWRDWRRSARFDTWPDCLGTARANLDPHERAAIDKAEHTLGRLNARLQIRDMRAASLRDELQLSHECKLRDAWNMLSDFQRAVMRAALARKAFNAESRQTRTELYREAYGRRPRGLTSAERNDFADLALRGLMESRRGGGGGCWLSYSGRELVERTEAPCRDVMKGH